MYYLFIIKDNYFKYNSKYLYELLYKLRYMKKEDYNYGVSLYYNICNLFDTATLNYYIKNKYKLKKINNKYYLDNKNYFEIRKSCAVINNNKYLKEILCIFYIYNKNIFICNFNTGDYFWIKDKLNNT